MLELEAIADADHGLIGFDTGFVVGVAGFEVRIDIAERLLDAHAELHTIDRARDELGIDVRVSRRTINEGARSNLFVREGQRLLTPPVRCGLLPGVLRATLLDRGEASEAVLSLADIKAASREGRLRVGNALRGLMPATLK